MIQAAWRASFSPRFRATLGCYFRAASLVMMLSAVARAAADASPPASAQAMASPAKQILPTPVSGGWLMQSEALDYEERAVLRYSYGGQPEREIVGVRTGRQWIFHISEQIPEAAMVTVKVLAFSKLDDINQSKAEGELRAFVNNLKELIVTAFTESVVAMSNGAADRHAQRAAILQMFKGEARVAIARLTERSKLAPYYFEQRPVLDLVMKGLAFERLGGDQWEPTEKTFQRLGAFWGPEGRRFENAGVVLQTDVVERPCSASIGPDSTLAEAETTLRACWTAFVGKARELVDKLQAAEASPEQKAALAAPLEVLKQGVERPSADLLLDGSAEEVGDSAEFLEGSYNRAFSEVIEQAAGDARQIELARAYAGARYAAALLLKKQLDEKLWSEVFRRNWSEAEIARETIYVAKAVQLFKHEPGRPRFFVSTGVLATELRSGWKLSLPVIASVCIASSGCETKGNGPAGDGLKYVSVDLGIKAVFLGEKDEREGGPSFLLGLGVTPFYAMHFSIGVNAFENAQTERANFAPYVSVSIDLLNGADILGALGMSKPQLQSVGNEERAGD